MHRLGEIGRFIGSLFILVAILVYLLAGVSLFQRNRGLRELPSIPGTVVEGFIYHRQTSLERVGIHSYGVRWMVRYRLQNTVYLSTTDLGYSSPSWRWAEHMKSKFPPETSVKVYYSPAMFGRIAIAGTSFAQRQLVAYTLLWLGTAFLVAGLAISFLSAERKHP